MSIHEGCLNLTEALRLWSRFGGQVSKPRRTGEVVCSHPAVGRSRVNCRRKDTPRDLLKRLRRLAELARAFADKEVA